jgi:hypothetical protein
MQKVKDAIQSYGAYARSDNRCLDMIEVLKGRWPQTTIVTSQFDVTSWDEAVGYPTCAASTASQQSGQSFHLVWIVDSNTQNVQLLAPDIQTAPSLKPGDAAFQFGDQIQADRHKRSIR